MKRKVKQHEPIAEWATMDRETGLLREEHLYYDYKDVHGHYPIAKKKLDVGGWVYLFLWLIIVVVWIVLFMLLMCKPASIAIALLEKFLFGGGWRTCVILALIIGFLILIWRKR